MHIRKLTGGVLLIAGTCIGAGMLALPITMGGTGFWLSTLLLIVCWLATYLAGLYVLEANMCNTEDSNYISMAKNLLGRPGEVVAWITYLLLLYSLMAAYLTGGGSIVRSLFEAATQQQVNHYLSPIPWIMIAGVFIYAGTRFVDGLNRVLMLGLLVSYAIIVMTVAPNAHVDLLNGSQFGHVLVTLPVLATAFGYHVIIPTLRTYLHGNTDKLAKVILFGSGLPLIIYILWNFVVFSTVPVHGEHSLISIFNAGGQPTDLINTMAKLAHTPLLNTITQVFIFFAIASSFLGIALSLFDFLADGLHIIKDWRGRVLDAVITFFPPYIYAVMYPKGFILALSYAGVFVAILHGILPALMVVAARRSHQSKTYRAPCGMIGVALIVLISLLVIGAEVAVNVGLIGAYK